MGNIGLTNYHFFVALPVTQSIDSLHVVQTSHKLSQLKFSFLFSQDHYDTVTEAISIFRDDPLLSDPGTSYLYTTHGWTLLSAVIEGASSEDFLPFMKKLFKELGMENTCAEFNDKIIYNRARLC